MRGWRLHGEGVEPPYMLIEPEYLAFKFEAA